jgi:glycine betaine/proline transport system permease protein
MEPCSFLDCLQDGLTAHKAPLGAWAKAFVNWLTDHAAFVFDGISAGLDAAIAGLLWLLQCPHPLVMILGLTLFAWRRRRSIGFAIFTAASLLLIVNLGYWEETTETVALVLASATVCMSVGVPIGIAAARRPWLFTLLRPVLDLMQTIPTFVYLIPALILFGLGMVPGLIATVIFAAPASIRLTHLGITSTPTSLIEAGEAFGASPSQLLWKVELPYAMPQIMAGLTQTIMLSLSMVVVAALVGADGLGVATLRALNQVNIAKGFEVGLVIVLVAILMDRLARAEGDR